MSRWSLVTMLLLLLSIGCSSPKSKTTDTRSESLADLAARREFLNNYLQLPSEVQELSFHVVYHDNSGGLVPGPSDWDIRLVARVQPQDLRLWSQGNLEQSQSPDTDWVEALVSWDLGDSSPQLFRAPGSTTLVFSEVGIVARWLTTFSD